MNYALIVDGVVINIISLHPSNAADFPNAVPTNDVLVEIGDTYADGVFYRNGVRLLSPLEQLEADTLAAEAAYIEGVQDA